MFLNLGVFLGATIPTVCLTIEEAELMERLIKRGKKVVVNMNLKSKNIGKITSRNIIFDITGKLLFEWGSGFGFGVSESGFWFAPVSECSTFVSTGAESGV